MPPNHQAHAAAAKKAHEDGDEKEEATQLEGGDQRTEAALAAQVGDVKKLKEVDAEYRKWLLTLPLVTRVERKRSAGPCDAQDRHGYRPLHDACMSGEVAAVRWLLGQGTGFGNASPGLPATDGITPVHYAAIHGHTDVIRLLIDHGASADVMSNSWPRASAGHWSAARGHAAATLLLLSRGGTVDMDFAAFDGKHGTFADLMARRGHDELADLLQTIQSLGGYRGWVAANKPDDTEARLKPLHHCARLGLLDLSRGIIALHGPNPRDAQHKTPLHHAAEGADPNVVALLLDEGAALNVLDADRFTPLMSAMENFQCGETNATMLLHCGADVSLMNNRGRLPLHYACERGLLDLVRLGLLTPDTPVDHRDHNGNSCLHVCCMHNRINCAMYLLSHGAATDVHDSMGFTPERAARYRKSEELADAIKDIHEDGWKHWKRKNRDHEFFKDQQRWADGAAERADAAAKQRDLEAREKKHKAGESNLKLIAALRELLGNDGYTRFQDGALDYLEDGRDAENFADLCERALPVERAPELLQPLLDMLPSEQHRTRAVRAMKKNVWPSKGFWKDRAAA